MLEQVKNELIIFFNSLKTVRLRKITKEKILFESISNGVAALVALGVYKLIHSFFEVDSNLKYGVKKIFAPKKIKAAEISQKDFDWIMDWIGNPIIFVITLVVFSLVEQVMEEYLRNREWR